MSRKVDVAVAEVCQYVNNKARPQGGVFRRRDLLAWGIDDATLQAMFRRGQWIRLRHGVFAETEALAGAEPEAAHRIHLAAAIAASEEPAFAFGPSAALLHGLPLPFRVPEALHIVRESRQDLRSLRRPSRHPILIPAMHITAHALGSDDVVVIDGIPCVSPRIAAITTAPGVGFGRKVGLFDSVLWAGKLSSKDLIATLDEWPRQGQRSQLIDAIGLARAGAQTFLETYSRLALIAQGLPEPLLQVEFHDSDGLIGFVDMYWPDFRVVGEADGAVKYSSRADLVAEKRREDRLRARGKRVVRWMSIDIHEHPERVAAQIRRSIRFAA